MESEIADYPPRKKIKNTSQEVEDWKTFLKAERCRLEGKSYFLNNKFEWALNEYQKIIFFLQYESKAEGELKTKKDALLCAGHLNLAACYLKLEKFRDVIEHSEKALEIQPKNPKGHFRKGKAYMFLQEFEKAKENFMCILEYDPSNSAAKKNITICNAKLKKQLEKEKKMYQNIFRKMAEEREKAAMKEVAHAVAEASNHFGVNLYYLLAKENKNVFFSPFCISTALAMLFCGAENETAEEMRKVLGYEVSNIKSEELKLCFQKLLSALGSNQAFYTLNCANSVLSNKEFSVKKEYKSLVEDFFNALFQEADFMNESEETIKLVNEWVKEKTNNMIPKILNSLDASTVMIILNAVYFNGFWLHPFDKRLTFPGHFYNKGDKDNFQEVDMMHHMHGTFLFTKNEFYKALQLPYKGDDISMLILLPNSKDGLSEVESSLSSTFIQDIKGSMWKTNVFVKLPKFKLQYSKSLKDSLQTMGLNRVFKLGADLKGISDSDFLFLSEVNHLAVFEADEKGCRAAAVTVDFNGGGRVPPMENHDFKVDHPFLFVIYYTKNNLILFMGRVTEL